MMKRTSVLDFLGVVRIVGYSLAIVPALIAVVLYLIGYWWPLAGSSWAPSSGRSSPDSLWRGSPGCRGCSSAECTSPAHRTDSMKQALEKLLRNNHAWADGVRNEDQQFRSEEHTSE